MTILNDNSLSSIETEVNPDIRSSTALLARTCTREGHTGLSSISGTNQVFALMETLFSETNFKFYLADFSFSRFIEVMG
jgi:hypothetical protein